MSRKLRLWKRPRLLRRSHGDAQTTYLEVDDENDRVTCACGVLFGRRRYGAHHDKNCPLYWPE